MKKNVIIIVALTIIAVPAVFAKLHNTKISTNNDGDRLTVSELHGSFSIKHDNIHERIGDADYVFVGEVISKDGTEYKHPVICEEEDGSEYDIASPYTNYTVSNLNNIKGELITGIEIPIQKAGGLAPDGSRNIIYEEDELPIPGGIYVFYAYAQPDGSLLVSGPNSNEKINVLTEKIGTLNGSNDISESIEKITEEPEAVRIQEIIDACETQVETNRDRFVSKYDASMNINAE